MISIIIPLFNEEANVPILAGRLSAALRTLGRDYEVIFINDGSTDATGDQIKKVCAADPCVVADDVNASELRHRCGEQGLYGLNLAHVGGDGECLHTVCTDLCLGDGEGTFLHIGEDDVHSLLGEGFGKGETDATRSSGDDGNLSTFEFHMPDIRPKPGIVLEVRHPAPGDHPAGPQTSCAFA